MSLWKSFANFCIKQNEKEIRDYNKRLEIKNTQGSCADCGYFHRYSNGKSYWCSKLDFCYDPDDVEYREIHHHRTCKHFFRW